MCLEGGNKIVVMSKCLNISYAYYTTNTDTAAVRLKTSSKILCANCVRYSARASILDVYPLQGHRSAIPSRASLHQGQQGDDVNEPFHGNYKIRLRGGPNLTAVQRTGLLYKSQH